MMLFALMLCPFCFTMGAFVFSGLLDPMARDLGVSVSTVATLQSAFAIACALCGPEPPPLKWSAPMIRQAEDLRWRLRDPNLKRLS